jgi:hypothetical protein
LSSAEAQVYKVSDYSTIMKKEAKERALDIVKKHVGEYTPIELIEQLRFSYINEGENDIGLENARKIVNNAINTGKIQLSVPEHSVPLQVESKRCYPTD